MVKLNDEQWDAVFALWRTGMGATKVVERLGLPIDPSRISQRAYRKGWKRDPDAAPRHAWNRSTHCGRCGAELSDLTRRACGGSICKRCHTVQAREWQDANPERAWLTSRAAWFRRQGVAVTADELTAWYFSQPQACRICGEPERAVHHVSGKKHRLSIDHDHATFQLRGLLCGSCNRALGLLRDDAGRIRKAAEYVESTGMID